MSNTGDSLPRLAHDSVTIQITPESKPDIPPWMGEVAAFAHVLRREGILQAITERVRVNRTRFGHYDLIDFVAVLIGYVLSGEPTLLAFYERLIPFAEPFMALFSRHQLPHRSTLSRFLAALNQSTVEELRALFQKDLLARKPFPSPGGLFDRTGRQWLVIDVDGTRQAARQRALPRTDALLLLIGCLIRSAPQAITDANEEKVYGPERLCFRRIPSSFWGPLVDLATGITEANYDEPRR